MAQDTETTRVVFRVEDDGKTVTAVFPFERTGTARIYYGCYSHVGQHSDCVKSWVLGNTRPATVDEYADLKAELEAEPFGYRLEVLPSWPRGA